MTELGSTSFVENETIGLHRNHVGVSVFKGPRTLMKMKCVESLKTSQGMRHWRIKICECE